MKTISQGARSVPVIAETDVLVVGSGPGGLAAALSAARAGVGTMVVERFGCLGGNITAVGVESIAWYRREGTVDCEGIGIEFEQRAKAMGATSPEPQSKSEAINADMFKHVADRLVAPPSVATPGAPCPGSNPSECGGDNGHCDKASHTCVACMF